MLYGRELNHSRLDGRLTIELSENDFVLVPAARDFTMSGLDGGPPKGHSVHSMVADEMRHGDPEGPANVRMVAGRLAFGSPDAGLLLSLLPELIHVRGLKRIATAVQLLRNEARDERPCPRHCLGAPAPRPANRGTAGRVGQRCRPGPSAGIGRRRLGSAIQCIHDDPRQAWTVDRLAKEASMSRSVFFARLRREVGIPPMESLLSWRMALARDMRRGSGGVKEVAETVGYGAAGAFSVAFTRFVGIAPTSVRMPAGLEAV